MDEPDRKIRFFLCIAHFGSLSRAAEHLQLSQPSLSRQLAVLETFFGKPLFERTGRGMQLTHAGERLHAFAAPAYKAIDDAVRLVRDEEGITQGNLRLATVHTLTYYFMGKVVASFAHQRDRVNLSFMGRSSPEVVTLVESGKAEIGFVYDSAVASDTLTSLPLFDELMCLIVRNDDSDFDKAVDLTQRSLRLVGFPSHYALRRMLHSSSLDFTLVAEADTVDAILKLVSLGMGACILPERIPDHLLVDYRLRKVRILAPLLWRRVVAIHRSEGKLSPLARLLLDIAIHTPPADL